MAKRYTILAIETATDICSAAIWHDDRVRIVSTRSRPRVHAERLTPMIEQILRYCNCAPRDLSAIAVSKGPGSYTGLRIGVSTAKGLAFAHDIPLVGVPSLRAFAAHVRRYTTDDEMFGVAFNARKNEVYFQLFKSEPKERVKDLGEVVVLHRNDISTYIDQWPAGDLSLAGEGSQTVAEALKDVREVNLLPATFVSPSAHTVAELGIEYFQKGRIDELASFEPFYLKEFVPKKRKTSAFERLQF